MSPNIKLKVVICILYFNFGLLGLNRFSIRFSLLLHLFYVLSFFTHSLGHLVLADTWSPLV